jgi:hypothetical protein
MEQLSTSQNNKLLSHKLSKDDLIRRASELEIKVKQKQAEIEEVNQRFEDHMKSNERTEKSLHERIGDMQSQIDLLKQLRDEDKYQV